MGASVQNRVHAVPTDISGDEGQEWDKKESATGQCKLDFASHMTAMAAVLVVLFVSQMFFWSHMDKIIHQQTAQTLGSIENITKSIPDLKSLPSVKVNNLTDVIQQAQQIITDLNSMHDKVKGLVKDSTSLPEALEQHHDRLKGIKARLNDLTNAYLPPSATQAPSLQADLSLPDPPTSSLTFTFPKLIWKMDELRGGDNEHLRTLYDKNNLYYADMDAYTIKMVTEFNYSLYLTTPRNLLLTHTLQTIEYQIKQPECDHYLSFYYTTIKKQLILLFILEQHGGIMMSDNLLMVQRLTWLNRIAEDQFVNKGNLQSAPNVFAFYNISRSSRIRIVDRQEREPTQRYCNQFPGINADMVVAKPKDPFIGALVEELVTFFTKPQEVIDRLEHWRETTGIERAHSPIRLYLYKEYVQAASTIVLLKKTAQMQKKGRGDKLAIDEYGLLSLNQNFAKNKMAFFFDNNQHYKLTRHLGKMSLQQFELQFGPCRYVQSLPMYEQMNQHFLWIRNGSEFMFQGSYVHKFFFPTDKKLNLLPNPEQIREDNEALEWDSLPRIIWVYWDSGFDNSNIVYQMCVDNMRRYGAQSGFTLIMVDHQTLPLYLDEQTIARIDKAIANKKFFGSIHYMKYDLYRLALMAKYGGVYMDASYILLQNLDWLIKIAQQPSNLIFNRYGTHPKVFLFFHPHYGSPFDFKYDKTINSKVAWHLGYENNFIAAEAKNEFVQAWLDDLLQMIVTPMEEVPKKFVRCQADSDRWSWITNNYLLPMDVMKYVVGCKQTQLQKQNHQSYPDASAYYGIWSMNGYTGQQKFRMHTSYHQTTHDNYFVRLYSQQQAEKIVGKVMYLTKLYSYPVKVLNGHFEHNYLAGTLDKEFHPQSIFMNYVYRQQLHDIQVIEKEGKKVLKLKQKKQGYSIEDQASDVKQIAHQQNNKTPFTGHDL